MDKEKIKDYLETFIIAFLLSILYEFYLMNQLQVENNMESLSPLDPSSFSRPGKNFLAPWTYNREELWIFEISELALVTNIELNLSVSFEKKIFTGFVILKVQKINDSATEVVSNSNNSCTLTRLNKSCRF